MVEDKAAPFMPYLGIKTKLKKIFKTNEIVAADAEYSGFPRPVRSADNILPTLNAKTPGSKKRKALDEIKNS